MATDDEAVWQRVQVHRGAPPKPAHGAPCNGCGLCCLAQPCPLGMLLSRRRQGPCAALRWDAARQRYLCGALDVRWLAPLARRWIAAGSGCDAQVTVEPCDAPG